MKRFVAPSLVGIILLSLVACAAPAAEEVYVEVAREVEMAAEAPEQAASAVGRAVGDSGNLAFQEQPPLAERKIIYRADMSLIVRDTEVAMQDIQNLVMAANGYVSDSNLSQYRGDLMRGYMTVRVPVERFDDIRAQLRDLAIRVLSESSNAQDVTEEYTDLEARLRNLEAAEKELLALLEEVRERPNAEAEDILEVFDAVTEKRGEIEQVKGRMQYLSNLTSLSTIGIELVPDEGEKPVIEEGWQPLVTLKDASRTLINLLQRLVDLLINVLIVILPFFLIIALPIFFLVRWLLRRRREAKQAE